MKTEKQSLTLTPLRLVLVALAIVLVWGVLSAAAYFVWLQGADHRDFFPRWAGARLALFEAAPLYAEETTRKMHLMLYGRLLPPDIDQQGFAYPAQIVIELAPLWLIDDVHIATAVWQGASALLMIGTLLGLMSVHDLPKWLIIPAMFWQYTLLMLFQGQFSVMAFAALGIGYLLYQRQHDVWAGVALCLGLVKPELMLIPCLYVCALALVQRRWRFLAGFLGCGLTLLIITVALFGWWIPPWLAQVAAYQQYAQSASAYQTAWTLHPLAALALALVFIAALRLLLRDFRYGFAASIVLGILALPQTLLWGLILLLLPLTFSWQGRARWGVVAVWLLGWAALFVERSNTTWRVETLVLAVLTLLVVLWASREGATTAPFDSRRSLPLHP